MSKQKSNNFIIYIIFLTLFASQVLNSNHREKIYEELLVSSKSRVLFLEKKLDSLNSFSQNVGKQ